MNYQLLLALITVFSGMFLTALLDIHKTQIKKKIRSSRTFEILERLITMFKRFFSECLREWRMRDHYKSYQNVKEEQRSHPYMIHSIQEGYLTFKNKK